MISGALIAIEGLDQSGKQTQAERLVTTLREHGRTVGNASVTAIEASGH